MKNHILFLLMVFSMVIISCNTNKPVTVYMIGDSTMADKPLDTGNPERGWGQLLPRYFNEYATIDNHSVNGRSSKSFIDEGRWQTVLDSIKAGDFLIIQFGHNDEKDYDSTRYTTPFGTYKANLEMFIAKSREKGAKPILCTPIMRRRFDENGKFFDTHGEYPDAVRLTAKEQQVPLVDMHVLSKELIVSKGPEGSKELFLWFGPDAFPCCPDGKQDDTHFCEYGAIEMAGLFAKDIKKQNLSLAKWLVTTDPGELE